MVTGRTPADGFTPPSQIHPDAGEAMDTLVLQALAQDPSARFPTPTALVDAFRALVPSVPRLSSEHDFATVDSGVVNQGPARPAAPNPPPMAPIGGAPRPAPNAPNAPQVGQRVSIHEEFRPSMVDVQTSAAPQTAAEVDLKDLLAKITENDAPRWMVAKDNLDHGPFSGRELVEQILKGEVVAGHSVLNMDTGQRQPVEEFSEFSEFLAQYQVTKRTQDEAQALVRQEKVEKASNAVKIAVGLGAVAVIAIVAGAFILTRESSEEAEVADADALADLAERGEIEITGTAGLLPEPTPGARGRRARGRRASGGGGGGGGAGGLSYEEAMNRAVNLGDVSQGGGERQLTPGDVAGVMNRHINSLYGCVVQELGRGGSISQVQIDLAIAGSGAVLGASARQGSGAFQSCIAARTAQIRFPTFPAPRMGARFSFQVD
jgi:hypothetical protein